MSEEIKLAIGTGQAAADLNKAAGAAENLEGKLQNVAEGAQVVTKATDQMGKAAASATEDFSGLVKMLNEFLSRRGSEFGQTVRLFSDQDAEVLQVIRAEFQGLVRDTRSLPNGIGNLLHRSGQSGVTSPEQINSRSIDRDAEKFGRMLDRVLVNVIGRAQHQTQQLVTGLTATELSGFGGTPTPFKPGPSPNHRFARHPQPGGESGLFQAARLVAGRTLEGTGFGGAAAATAQGSSNGLAGMLPGGLVGGGLLGLGGFAAFKAAGAVNDGLDRTKTEAIELDRFKRQLGDVGISFDDLRDNLRAASEGMGQTYEQSRKLATTFAETSDTRTRNTEALGQETRTASEFGRATGIGGEAMAKFFGEMRSGRVTDTVQDSKRLALAMADAIKRSGSSVNADQMLQSIASYTAQMRDATLGKVNATGYADVLSGMIGTGMRSGTASGILNRFDTSFRGGGSEAADAFTFQALDGNRLGAGRAMALRDAGLMASEKSVFGDKNNPIAKFYGVDEGASPETNLSKVMKAFDKQYMSATDPGSKDAAALSLANYMKTTQAQALGFYGSYKSHGSEGLNQTSGMLDRFKIDPARVNGLGIGLLSDIANAKGLPELENARRSMVDRKDLTDPQRASLKAAEGETSTEKLRAALVDIAVTLDSEKTQGQALLDANTNMENNIQKLATDLIPASLLTNQLLGGLVEKLAPDSDIARRMRLESEDKSIMDTSTPDAVSRAGKIIAGRNEHLLPGIFLAEKRHGLQRGELAGLIEHESNFRHDVYGKGVDKNGNTYSTKAYGLGQMTPAAVKDATPEFMAQYRRAPNTDDPFDQIKLAAIYKAQTNKRAGGDVGLGNKMWFAGEGGMNGYGMVSREQIEAFNKDVSSRQSKYQGSPIGMALPMKQVPVQVPAGNPERAATHDAAVAIGRRAAELSMAPITVNGNFTLTDPSGQQRADPVSSVSKIRKPLSSGYAVEGSW